MKKVSNVLVEKKTYEVKKIMGNFALIEMNDGCKGLFARDTSQLVLSFDNEKFSYFDEKNGLFFIIDIFNMLQVYDINKRKLIVEPTLLLSASGNTYILRDGKTGKIKLFHKDYYKDCASILVDDINPVGYDYFKVKVDNKWGMYLLGQGFVVEAEYDDITLIDYKKDGRKIYELKTGDQVEIFSTANNKIIPASYDKVRVDGETVIGISCECYGNVCDFYYYDEEFLEYDMFEGDLICDEIGRVVINQGTGYINYRKGLKSEIKIYSDYCLVPLLTGVYNDVTSMFGDKAFPVTASYYDNTNQECKFDTLRQLGNDYYYVNENGFGSIVKISGGQCETIVLGIDSYFRYGQENQFIYTKDGKMGIITIDGEDIVMSDLYDYVRYLGLKNAIVKNEGKQGLMQNGKLILSCDFDEIYSSEVTNDDEILYFAYSKGEGEKHGLARTFKNGAGFMKIGEYDNVIFYKDIMVLKNSDWVRVYNYQGKHLASFVSKTVISMDSDGENYLVNGENWVYKDGQFKEKPVLKENLYMTAYECKYGTIVVNSNSKVEHDIVCASIDDIDSKDIEKTLRSFYRKTPSLKEKYPRLVRKKK